MIPLPLAVQAVAIPGPARRAGVVFALLLLFLAAGARGLALTWERTLVVIDAKAGDDTITAEFTFTNNGPKAVRILDTKSSCGCVTALLDKTTYLPGESGSIQVYFDTRGMSGLQEKSIRVFSDDSPGAPAMLNLRASIPAWYKLETTALEWRRDEAVGEKTIILNLAVSSRAALRLTSVSSDQFVADLKLVAGSDNYILSVHPKTTSGPQQANFIIVAEKPGGGRQTYVVVARVR